MQKDFHDIDRIFKGAIDNGYRETPPPAVWDGIDHALESKKYMLIEKKYRHLKRLTAALFVLLLSFGLFEVFHHFVTEKETLVQTNTKGNTDENKISVNTNNDGASDQIQEEKLRSKNVLAGNFVAPIRSKDIIINGNQVFRSNKNGVHTSQKGNTTIIEDNVESLHSGNISGVISNHSLAETTKETRSINASAIQPHLLSPVNGVDASVSNPLKRASASSLTNSIKLKKFKPYFSLMPVYGFENPSYRIQNEKKIVRWIGPGGPGPFEEKDEIRNTPQKISSFSAGILGDYHLTKHWSVQSGLMLSQITSTTSETRKIFAVRGTMSNIDFRFNSACGYAIVDPKFDLATTATPALGDSLFAEETKSKLTYLAVPLSVKYSLKAGKFSFYASAGVAANILLNAKLESTIKDRLSSKEKEINTDIHGLRRIYYSGLLGIGAEYAFTNRISLNIIPNTKLAFNSLNKDGIVTSYYNSTGVMAGIRVKL